MTRELELLEDLRDGIDTFVERWTKIQRNSVKSVQAVANRIVQIEHLEGSLGELDEFQDIREKTRGKLLVDLFDKLVPALEASIKEFTKLMKMFETLGQKAQTIQTFTESLRGSESEIPQIDDLVGFLDLIVISVQDILSMFEHEFLVKITIYRDLEEGSVELGVISNYLTVWTAEPNIEPGVLDKLLKDLDEHFELLRDVFAGKTGIRLPEHLRKASY
ncbi:MAG: hypothetical protein JSW61_03770 [Candidatus Thorarchaeota archaeon]|nr:MAG: hypothetical protein JSW61_03770 [Candidatus Thorarchaeota archaeon]